MAWQSAEVTVNGLQFYYERTGGDKPTVVLVHGMTDHGAYWSRVARALEDSYDLVMYDMRGHGRSATPTSGYTPTEYANDLLGVVSALGLERPAVVGHSLGATTTFTAAAQHSAALRCIVLEDPPWSSQLNTDENRAMYGENWKIGNTALQQLDHAGRVAQCQAEHPSWVLEDCELWAESKRLVRPQIFEGFSALIGQPWASMAPGITCPALLITGDPELGAIVTPATAEAFTQLVPHSQVVQIPGAGHAIHREQLDLFVGAVRSFLKAQGI